jgi:hypothetical protein
VGFTSGLKAADKPALTGKLEAIVAVRSFTGNTPGGSESVVNKAVVGMDNG